MSDIRKVLETRLIGNTTIYNALGSTTLNPTTVPVTTKTIFFDHLPALETVSRPAIVYKPIDSIPKDVNIRKPRIERWQIDVEASTLDTLETIVNAVIESMDRWRETGTTYVIIKSKWLQTDTPEFDQDTELWSVSMDFLIEYSKL